MGTTTASPCTCYRLSCDRAQKELIKNQKFLEQKQRNAGIITIQKFILRYKTKQTRNYVTSYILQKVSNYIYYNNSARKADPIDHKTQFEQTLQETVDYLTKTFPDDQCEHISILRNSLLFENCWLTLKQLLIQSVNAFTKPQHSQCTLTTYKPHSNPAFTLSTYDSIQNDFPVELDRILSYSLNSSVHNNETPLLFKAFETQQRNHTTVPKCLYNLTKALYSIYLYRKFKWLKTTNRQCLYFQKKNIMKTLDMRLKENERQTTKVIAISKDAFPKHNKRYLHSNTNATKDVHAYNIYNGEFDKYSSLYHGYGILIKNNASHSYYEGLFKNGKRNGFGLFMKELSNYSTVYYIGEFKRNKFHGHGIKIIRSLEHITIQKGMFSASSFANGEQHTYSISNKAYQIYKGRFNSSEQFCDDNGYLFTKHFKQSKTNSLSVDNTYEYKGAFDQGKPNGYGELHNDFLKKGYSYVYKGNFMNGMKEGYGIVTYSDNYFVKQYEGSFHNDKEFYLYGKVLFKSGDVYEGFFDMDNQFKNGVGLYLHYDVCLGKVRDRFFGEFGKDKKDGLGVFVAPLERKSLIGKYCDGEKVGVFELNEYYVDKSTCVDTSGLQPTNENSKTEMNESEKDGEEGSCCNVKGNKMYLLMENNDIVDKSYKKENLVF